MSKGLVSGLVLLTLGLILGLILAGVNSITAPVIQENEQNMKFNAIGEFYDLAQYTITEEKTTDGGPIDALYYVYDSTDTLSAIVYSVKEYGFQSDVKMLIAITSDLKVDGFKVVEQGESGNGSMASDYNFGMDGVSVPDLTTFDAIANATYTSNAVKDCFQDVFSRTAADFGGGN